MALCWWARNKICGFGSIWFQILHYR